MESTLNRRKKNCVFNFSCRTVKDFYEKYSLTYEKGNKSVEEGISLTTMRVKEIKYM